MWRSPCTSHRDSYQHINLWNPVSAIDLHAPREENKSRPHACAMPHKCGFSTLSEHLSAVYQTHLVWSPERLINWGSGIGVVTSALVTRLREIRKQPEHGYRACQGLPALTKCFGKPRLETTCVAAPKLGMTIGTHICEILINGLDQVAPSNTAQ